MINQLGNYTPELILITMTAIAASLDIRTHKIPNLLTFPTILAATAYFTAVQGYQGFLFSIGGLFTGLALLLLPYLMGGMGAGDAKLMGAVGAWLGAGNTIKAFLFIASTGCIYGLIVVIVHRHRFQGYLKQLWLTAQTFLLARKYVPVESGAVVMSRPKVYYGVAIAAGTLIYLVLEITGYQISI
jgi:prepilin peptidase CpaA